MQSDLSVFIIQNYIQTEKLAYWVGCDTSGETKLFLALNDVIILIYIHFLETERIASANSWNCLYHGNGNPKRKKTR